jgi:chromosomal replication initiation ATPase DnaA
MRRVPTITLGEVLDLVHRDYGAVILQGTRRTEEVWPRMVFYWLAGEANHSLSAIGRFTHRDHTTIRYGVKRVQEERTVNPSFCRHLDRLITGLDGGGQ